MNKILKIVLAVFVAFMLIFIVIALLKQATNINDKKDQDTSDRIKKIENEKQVAIYEAEQKYAKELDNLKNLQENVYNNPIIVGLYTQGSTTKNLTPSWNSNWDKDNIMGMFYTVYTNKTKISSGSFNSLWNDYASNYPSIVKYKIGYNIKYSLKNGETVDKLILKPSDTDSLFKDLQFYLYDDVTPMPGRRYYHMTQPEVTDKTIYTSVKIVAYKETAEVVSPIELTAFTYDGPEDFDVKTGKYIGNSKYVTLLNRK